MNSKKISLEEFRNIRKKMNVIIDKTNKDNLTEEETTELFNNYYELQSILLSYDLSEIPFEEWDNYTVASTNEISADFSKTGANIDFKIINYVINGNFKGCNVRNLEALNSKVLVRESFDKKTIEENSNLFLSDNFDADFQDKFCNKNIRIEDLISLSNEQISELKEKNIRDKLDYKEQYNRLLSMVGLDKTIEICRYYIDDYTTIVELLNKLGNYDDEQLFINELKETDISNIKSVVYTYFRNSFLLNTHNYFFSDNHPERFVEENKDIFLIDIDISDSVRKRYLERRLTIQDLIDYNDIFKNIPIDYFIDSSYDITYTITDNFGIGKFQELVNKYKETMLYLSNGNNYELAKFFSEMVKKKKDNDNLEDLFLLEMKEKVVDFYKAPVKNIPRWVKSLDYEIIEKINTNDDLLNYTNKTIILDDSQRELIDKIGIDNIKIFEKETGFFSHRYLNYSKKEVPSLNLLLNYFHHINYYRNNSDFADFFEKDKLNYEEFCQFIAQTINYYTTRPGTLYYEEYYDWLKGDFRESHKELFLDIEAPIEYKEVYYNGKITLNYISKNKDIIPYLLDKDLKKIIKNTTYIKVKDKNIDLIKMYSEKYGNEKTLLLIQKYGDFLSDINLELDDEELINERIKEEVKEVIKSNNPFMKMYAEKYGDEKIYLLIDKYKAFLRNINLDNINLEQDEEVINKKIREAILKNIINEECDYSNLFEIEEFREEYKEIFININKLDIPEKDKIRIKRDYYTGNLKFEDIKKYKELKELLKDKDINMGLRRFIKYSYPNDISKKGPIGIRLNKRIRLDSDEDNKISIFPVDKEIIIELGSLYGKYLDLIIIDVIKNIKTSDKDIFIQEVENILVNKIISGVISYNPKDLPSSFVKSHPNLFLDENVDSAFQEKFYSKQLTLKDVVEDNSLIDMCGNTSIMMGFPSEFNWISELFAGDKAANYYRVRVALQYDKLKDDACLAAEFQDYLLKHKDNININTIDSLGTIIYRLSKTNSTSLYSVRETLAQQLMNLENPLESYEKIENIFLRNHLPDFAKMYYCFYILYPDMSKKIYDAEVFDFSESSRLSPELKDETLADVRTYDSKSDNTDKRFQIIFNDLVRVAVKSNSLDLRRYLHALEVGEDLYNKVIQEGIDLSKLSEEEKEVLETYEMYLEVIYESSKKGKENPIDLDDKNLMEKIGVLTRGIGPTRKYDTKDRIVRMFAYGVGYHSFEELKDDMEKAALEADERGRRYAEEFERERVELEDGDFLRCIGDYRSLGGSLDRGNFSKEFMSTILGYSGSDTTPLDIDWTLVEKRENIYRSVEGTPTGFGFGNVYLVMKKDNPNIKITRDKDGNLIDSEYAPQKIEMFGTKVGDDGYETHWGSRTGISLTDIDYILYKKTCDINSFSPYDKDGNVQYINDSKVYDDLMPIKFEIARHGYYIPVVDFSGKLIYTVEEYEELREKMAGLSYYEDYNYSFSDNLDIDGMIMSDAKYPSVEEIVDNLDESITITNSKREKVINVLKEVFDKYGLKIKREMDGEITPGSVEIIDTGSTGRGTNKIGEGDFDFLLRLDNDIYMDDNRLQQFKNDISNVLSQYKVEHKVTTDRGDLRYKGVSLPSGDIVDIDITYDRKTDKIGYTTDECIKDRLDTLKGLDEEKYKKVLANIILAKQVLKDASVYKSKNSAIPQGGLGGVGIENWILQHGGSFIDAARSFCEAAEGRSFDEFKSVYSVWDFGENHTSERKLHYPHDNFITDNMSIDGYDRMKKVLREYLNNYELNNLFEEENESKIIIDRQII